VPGVEFFLVGWNETITINVMIRAQLKQRVALAKSV
jgi:hypothetical protein